MDVKVRNVNFLSKFMNQKDIKRAFDKQGYQGNDYIYDVLLEGGWIRKRNERYFEPTMKLWVLAFGAKELVIPDDKMRMLNEKWFFKKDLNNMFRKIVTIQLIEGGYFILEKGRYRKSVTFEEQLGDGDNVIVFGKEVRNKE